MSIVSHARPYEARARRGAERLTRLADPRAAGVDNATLEAMLARFRAPWYVNFYMSLARWSAAR